VAVLVRASSETGVAGGARIAWTDTGAPSDRPDAPTVVFGHGLMFGGWMFRHQIDALRDRYRCVTLDWRGQGDSPATAAGYDMDTLTGDAVALIGELDAGPVHWVGLSMGGFVGLRLAARHPDLLRSLTLLGSSADAEDPASAGEYRALAWVHRLVGIRPIAGRVTTHLFGRTFLAEPAARPIVAEWRRRLARSDRAGVRRAVLGVTDRTAVTSELGAIAVPTLVAVGAEDTATPPSCAERIAERVKGARLEVIDRCGHSSTLERPDTVTALLTTFLAEPSA
jgi:3-oxoadipate enol-lactonase